MNMRGNQTAAELKVSKFYEYHNATKHTVQRLYSSGHRLDWASQPNPFLHYDGAELIDLPRQFQVSTTDYFATVASQAENAKSRGRKNENENVAACSDFAEFLSNLLFSGMAISAWKQVVGTDSKWALRSNASSGNLHPTDTHVLVRQDTDQIKAGAYHYRVDEHRLEKRLSLDLVTPLVERLGINFEAPPLVLCLSSIFFREAWKYRDRAFRYCQHDMGHALASLTLSAASFGWDSRVVCLFPDDEVTDFLGLRATDEKPLALMLLAPKPDNLFPLHENPLSLWKEMSSGNSTFPSTHTKLVSPGESSGEGCSLSSRIIDYPSMQRVYDATKYTFETLIETRHRLEKFYNSNEERQAPGQIVAADEVLNITTRIALPDNFDSDRVHQSVHKTIRKRRSAVDMDGETGMPKADFELILRSSTLGFPADFQGVDDVNRSEWRASSNWNLIHLYLYIHRVQSVEPGLYYFDRSISQLVPLLLKDQRDVAKATSCFQDIACDGAFSVSMVTDFSTGYELYGDRCYRLAHYEAGYIGQHFYLSACALGHDATGIGCFLDDDINKYLVLDSGKEVIYNFTFGKAVHDPRLTTLPSYDFEHPQF